MYEGEEDPSQSTPDATPSATPASLSSSAPTTPPQPHAPAAAEFEAGADMDAEEAPAAAATPTRAGKKRGRKTLSPASKPSPKNLDQLGMPLALVFAFIFFCI